MWWKPNEFVIWWAEKTSYQSWNELRDMQVKEQLSWFKYSRFNDLNWNLRVSWWKWSILLVTRTQHQPSLAVQQLCPRLLFLCSAITPALVPGKPAPVSLAVQSVAPNSKQTSIKRSQQLQLRPPQPFQFSCVGKEYVQEEWVRALFVEGALLC